MWKSKDVYYISDSTGILVANLGRSLLCQFPAISFHEENIPFILTKEDAEKTMHYILKNSLGRKPLIFSTIMDPEIIKILDTPEVEFIDAYAFFLERLEISLEAEALREPGYSRHIDNVSMAKRVEAINFSMEHDDGNRLYEFNEAAVILLGISRAGKTPISVYLATQMGLKSANFPLTVEYLNQYQLPNGVQGNIKKTVGLTTTPELLRTVREIRYPGSKYASITTCRKEIRQAEEIYRRFNIPVISSAGKSIEEIATQVLQELNLSKKTKNMV